MSFIASFLYWSLIITLLVLLQDHNVVEIHNMMQWEQVYGSICDNELKINAPERLVVDSLQVPEFWAAPTSSSCGPFPLSSRGIGACGSGPLPAGLETSLYCCRPPRVSLTESLYLPVSRTFLTEIKSWITCFPPLPHLLPPFPDPPSASCKCTNNVNNFTYLLPAVWACFTSVPLLWVNHLHCDNKINNFSKQ